MLAKRTNEKVPTVFGQTNKKKIREGHKDVSLSTYLLRYFYAIQTLNFQTLKQSTDKF